MILHFTRVPSCQGLHDDASHVPPRVALPVWLGLGCSRGHPRVCRALHRRHTGPHPTQSPPFVTLASPGRVQSSSPSWTVWVSTGPPPSAASSSGRGCSDTPSSSIRAWAPRPTRPLESTSHGLTGCPSHPGAPPHLLRAACDWLLDCQHVDPGPHLPIHRRGLPRCQLPPPPFLAPEPPTDPWALGRALGLNASRASLSRVFSPIVSGLLYEVSWQLPFVVSSASMLLAAGIKFAPVLP
jgi:hypothetical protein